MFEDLAQLMCDPAFAQTYQVLRTRGEWIGGRFVLSDAQRLNFYGPVQPASERELEQLAEGDRQKGVMKFLCKMPCELFLTHDQPGDAGISDEVVWNGSRYKIVRVMPWNHYGWMRAFGCLTGGEAQKNA